MPSIILCVDKETLSFIGRHTIALAVVCFACAAVGAVFAFARPMYHAASADTTVLMQSEQHYSLSRVQHAFARHGFRLGQIARLGDAKRGAIVLGLTPAKRATAAFSVTLYGPQAVVHFDLASHELRLGNVAVNPGANDDQVLLVRVRAAMADLR